MRLRRTTPCDTTIAPEITTPSTTTDIAPTRNVTNERRFGTYSWSQDYWRKGDPSLINFGASDIGKLWNSGDVYVNIADNTNPDRIHSSMISILHYILSTKRTMSIKGKVEQQRVGRIPHFRGNVTSYLLRSE
mmetsp:Transcript_5043/g.4275  ORF Transcript_5043/g.4275 Transcript_5043/m.4275 type:complete len:133 (+) Transcript_5043:3-401(+)